MEIIEMKLIQTFFHETYKVKWNKIMYHVDMRKIETYANLTVFYLIYNVVHCLNECWKLFLGKVYQKRVIAVSFVQFYSVNV